MKLFSSQNPGLSTTVGPPTQSRFLVCASQWCCLSFEPIALYLTVLHELLCFNSLAPGIDMIKMMLIMMLAIVSVPLLCKCLQMSDTYLGAIFVTNESMLNKKTKFL